jgi:hypothetical protein
MYHPNEKSFYFCVATAMLIIFVHFSVPDTARGDGNNLLPMCNAAVSFADENKGQTAELAANAAFCLGMMQGITQTNRFYEVTSPESVFFCLPKDGITNGQAARIVAKWLREHPEQLHMNETVLSIRAFMDAFPCKGK